MKTPVYLLALAAMLFCSAASSAATIYNAGADLMANELAFEGTPTETISVNATVPRWSYGYRDTALGPALTLFPPTDHVNNGARQGFSDQRADGCCGALPLLAVNTGAPFGDPDGSVATGEFLIHPDGSDQGNFLNEQKAVVRFTASIPGNYSVSALWEDLNACCGGAGEGVDVSIVKNSGAVSTSLFSDAISRETNDGLPDGTTPPTFNVTLAVGESLDFVVGTNGQLYGDSTRFNAILTVPEPSSMLLLAIGAVALVVRRRKV